MQTFKEILSIFAAFLTPTIAVVTTIILVSQYRLEKMRWRLALYDKRYLVYQKTMQFLSEIYAKANVTNDELFAFLHDVRDKDLLFGKDVQELLEQIYLKAVDLNSIESELKHLPKGELLNNRVKDSSQLFKWFRSQRNACKEIIGDYLRIDKK
jgi:hypothetical protein